MKLIEIKVNDMVVRLQLPKVSEDFWLMLFITVLFSSVFALVASTV